MNLEALQDLKNLVQSRQPERKLQQLLKTNMSMLGACFSMPPGEYIGFAEYPFGEGRADFVIFTFRSRMRVVIVEIKGADFTFSTRDGAIAAEVNLAAQQLRNRFAYVESNLEFFRRRAHEDRRRAEQGDKRYGAFLGPKVPLHVDPMKDVGFEGAIIGGAERDEEYESRERTKLESGFRPFIRYDSWNSFLRRIMPRESDRSVDLEFDAKDAPFPIGARVRTKVAWAGIPIGSEGIVDELWKGIDGVGIMVAWDLQNKPLPPGYRKYKRELGRSIGLRDGFSVREAKTLELVAPANPSTESDS